MCVVESSGESFPSRPKISTRGIPGHNCASSSSCHSCIHQILLLPRGIPELIVAALRHGLTYYFEPPQPCPEVGNPYADDRDPVSWLKAHLQQGFGRQHGFPRLLRVTSGKLLVT